MFARSSAASGVANRVGNAWQMRLMIVPQDLFSSRTVVVMQIYTHTRTIISPGKPFHTMLFGESNQCVQRFWVRE
jgi:hypothetical protein